MNTLPKRPLTIWILQTGEPLHVDAGDARPMRAINVANAVVAAGHRAVVWTAAFSHQEKRHRSRSADRIVLSEDLEYRLIPSPGYERNVGVGRLWDHAVLARRLGQLLRRETMPPDVCVIGYPPIETAAVMSRWLKERGVPSLLDVKDQWPLIFLEPLPGPLKAAGRMFLWPYFSIARRTMREVTGVTAMAEGFLLWALEFAGRARTAHDRVTPLTSPESALGHAALAEARGWWAERGIADDGKVRFCFIGSQTGSFDFKPVVEAARELAVGHPECELIICGTGQVSDRWRDLAADLPNVVFPGWVDQARIRVLAELSRGFIAPYKNSDGFNFSIPNKIIDALSLGLPIVTPLRGEVAGLIERYGVGLRYGSDSGHTLSECLVTLMSDARLQRRLSANARALYDAEFTYERVYGGLVQHLEALAATAQPSVTHG